MSEHRSDDEEPLTKTKLFTLGEDGAWTDMGVGIASVADDTDNGMPILRLDIITIPMPDEHEEVLLSTPVSTDDIYTVQKGSILVWCDPELGRDMAASFHSKEGCSFIVDKIKEYQLSVRRRKDEAIAAQQHQQQQQQQQNNGRLSRSNSQHGSGAQQGQGGGGSGSTLLDDASNDPLAYSSPWSVCKVNLPAISRALNDNKMRIGGHIREYREFVYEVCTLFMQCAAVVNAAAEAEAVKVEVKKEEKSEANDTTSSSNNDAAVKKESAASEDDVVASSQSSNPLQANAATSSSSSTNAQQSKQATPVASPEAVAEAKRAINHICDIIMIILAQHSTDVKILSQIVEDRNIETIVDIVQYAIGKRDKASGFVTREQRHAMFRDPAHLPPSIVNKIHNFFAVQYLRDLVPQVLEEGDPGVSLPLVSLLLVRARHTMLTELMNADILRNALKRGQPIEHNRGMIAMMLDITTYVKNTSAVGADTKTEVFAKAIELGLLDFIAELFMRELSLADTASMSGPALQQASDCLSHLSMWSPVQCSQWLLKNASEYKGAPRLDPHSPIYKSRVATINAITGASASRNTSVMNRSLTPSSASSVTSKAINNKGAVASHHVPTPASAHADTPPPSSRKRVDDNDADDDANIGNEESAAAASAPLTVLADSSADGMGGGADQQQQQEEGAASGSPSVLASADANNTATADDTANQPSSPVAASSADPNASKVKAEKGADGAAKKEDPFRDGNSDFSKCSLLYLLFEALAVVKDPVAAQAVGDAIHNVGVGTLQMSAMISMFGVEVVTLRKKILAYWCQGPTEGGGGGTSIAAVPLFVAMLGAAQIARFAPENVLDGIPPSAATAGGEDSLSAAVSALPTTGAESPASSAYNNVAGLNSTPKASVLGEKRSRSPVGSDALAVVDAETAVRLGEGNALVGTPLTAAEVAPESPNATSEERHQHANDGEDDDADYGVNDATQTRKSRTKKAQRDVSLEHDTDVDGPIHNLPTSAFTRHLRDLNKCPMAVRRGAAAAAQKTSLNVADGGENGNSSEGARRGARISNAGQGEVTELQCLRVLRLLAKERLVSCGSSFADLLRNSNLLAAIASALHPKTRASSKLCCIASEFLAEVIKTNASRLLHTVIASHIMDSIVRLHETLPRRSSVLSSSILAIFNVTANSVADAKQRITQQAMGGLGIGGLGGGPMSPYLSRLAVSDASCSAGMGSDSNPNPPDLSLVDHVLLHYSSYIGYFAPSVLRKLQRVKETDGNEIAEEGESSAIGSYSEARAMSETEFQAILVEYGCSDATLGGGGGGGCNAMSAAMDTGMVLSSVPHFDEERTMPGEAEDDDENENDNDNNDESEEGEGVAANKEEEEEDDTDEAPPAKNSEDDDAPHAVAAVDVLASSSPMSKPAIDGSSSSDDAVPNNGVDEPLPPLVHVTSAETDTSPLEEAEEHTDNASAPPSNDAEDTSLVSSTTTAAAPSAETVPAASGASSSLTTPSTPESQLPTTTTESSSPSSSANIPGAAEGGNASANNTTPATVGATSPLAAAATPPPATVGAAAEQQQCGDDRLTDTNGDGDEASDNALEAPTLILSSSSGGSEGPTAVVAAESENGAATTPASSTASPASAGATPSRKKGLSGSKSPAASPKQEADHHQSSSPSAAAATTNAATEDRAVDDENPSSTTE